MRGQTRADVPLLWCFVCGLYYAFDCKHGARHSLERIELSQADTSAEEQAVVLRAGRLDTERKSQDRDWLDLGLAVGHVRQPLHGVAQIVSTVIAKAASGAADC